MMEYFWYTAEIIPEGMGFSQFGPLHLGWLAAFVAVTAACCLLYRRLGQKGRSIWKKTVAVLLIADELFKLVPMLILGRFEFDYLPFHLCSINLFLITYHAWHGGRLMDNFLYTVCIPGALAALLFPSWTKMPGLNYMNIHSFLAHVLLAMYPIVLTAAGEIKPEWKQIPRCLALLAGLAALALVLNLLLDTNYMFLLYAKQGNPLYWFQENWGSHLLGFPVLITAVIVVMHVPWILARRLKKK